MKTPALASLILAVAICSSAFANPADDFQTLQTQRQAAINQATKTIDARYAAQLKILLPRAAQAGDYATAAAIKDKLKSMGDSVEATQNDTGGSRKQLSDYLLRGDWTWVDLYPKNHPRLHFRFKSDGSLEHFAGWTETPSSWGFNHWAVVSGDEFSIRGNSYSLYFKVDRNTNTITLDKEKSPKGHQDKEILYGNQTHSSGPNSTGDNQTHFFGTKEPQ